MDGRRKDGWKDGQTSKTAQETSVPTPLSPAPALVSSSPWEGRGLLVSPPLAGFGGREGLSPGRLLCSPLWLTGFAVPDLHSQVY